MEELMQLEPLIRDLEKSITLLTMVVAKQLSIDVACGIE